MSITVAGSAGRLRVALQAPGPDAGAGQGQAPAAQLAGNGGAAAGRAAQQGLADALAARRQRADALAAGLRRMIADAAGTVPPPLPVLPGPTVEWIRGLTSAAVRSPEYEEALAQRTLVDLFGFLALPRAPAFLGGLSLAGLPAEHAAPLLTRPVSYTHLRAHD